MRRYDLQLGGFDYRTAFAHNAEAVFIFFRVIANEDFVRTGKLEINSVVSEIDYNDGFLDVFDTC